MHKFEFTEQSFEKFKAAYKESVEKQKESFDFDGHEVFTLYAKYIIEYVEWNDSKRS